jgi:hypothetical protein
MAWNEDNVGSTNQVDTKLKLKDGGQFSVQSSDGTDLLVVKNDTKTIELAGGSGSHGINIKKGNSSGSTGGNVLYSTAADSLNAQIPEIYTERIHGNTTNPVAGGDPVEPSGSDPNSCIELSENKINLRANTGSSSGTLEASYTGSPKFYYKYATRPLNKFSIKQNNSSLEANIPFLDTIVLKGRLSIAASGPLAWVADTWYPAGSNLLNGGTATNPAISGNVEAGKLHAAVYDSCYIIPLDQGLNVYRTNMIFSVTNSATYPTGDFDIDVWIGGHNWAQDSEQSSANVQTIYTGDCTTKICSETFDKPTNQGNLSMYKDEKLTSPCVFAPQPFDNSDYSGNLVNHQLIIPWFRCDNVATTFYVDYTIMLGVTFTDTDLTD